jgi:hypothetical protein
MCDVWWGLCEPRPGQYSFGSYRKLFQLCRKYNLLVQAVMSFHKCGGNVGDAVTIPLPNWVVDLLPEHPSLFYRAQDGTYADDYISLSCDEAAIFPSAYPNVKRTALDIYEEFMRAFNLVCGDLVYEIQVGTGPCGELRYPSYMLSQGWDYPNIGTFMSWDDGMLVLMQQQIGRSSPPVNAGTDNLYVFGILHALSLRFFGVPSCATGVFFACVDISAGVLGLVFLTSDVHDCAGQPNDTPDDTDFFSSNAPMHTAGDNFRSRSGRAFLEWYRDTLIAHGDRVLSRARRVFPAIHISLKVAGIHWLNDHPSKAAEVCKTETSFALVLSLGPVHVVHRRVAPSSGFAAYFVVPLRCAGRWLTVDFLFMSGHCGILWRLPPGHREDAGEARRDL